MQINIYKVEKLALGNITVAPIYGAHAFWLYNNLIWRQSVALLLDGLSNNDAIEFNSFYCYVHIEYAAY
jgi:hypothetical protein